MDKKVFLQVAHQGEVRVEAKLSDVRYSFSPVADPDKPVVIEAVNATVYVSNARRQLTIGEINDLPEAAGPWPMGLNNRIMALIRAVERAHGITEKP